MADITNDADILDSRDIESRISDLEESRAASTEYAEENSLPDEWATSEEGEEYAALVALRDEAEGYCPDWRDGAALIRDSYFTEYAKQLADDIGAIDSAASWPTNCIDWEQAADELKQDYTAVNFDGVEYWVR